jgi:mannose-6-phosphate isomerase-like protein (cupin superfamily)
MRERGAKDEWRRTMAQAGDVLRNDRTEKQRIMLRKTASETAGALLEMEAFYKPGGKYPPDHYHPHQDERFEVLAGSVNVRRGGVEMTYSAGQSFDVPRGTAHTFRNGGGEEARVIWQVRPALKTQQFYETLFGLAADGRTNRDGVPHLLQLAVMLQDYGDEFVLSSPPRFLQRAVFPVLAWIGRCLGYRSSYDRYSGPEALYAAALPTKPYTARASIWIDRPAQEVFGVVANYNNDAEWRNVISMRQTPGGEARVGAVNREEIDFLGKRYVTVSTITGVQPGVYVTWEATESTFPIAGWRLVTAENGGARFTEAVTADMRGLNRLMAPMMVGALAKQMEAEVGALKRMLEQRAYKPAPALRHEAT